MLLNSGDILTWVCLLCACDALRYLSDTPANPEDSRPTTYYLVTSRALRTNVFRDEQEEIERSPKIYLRGLVMDIYIGDGDTISCGGAKKRGCTFVMDLASRSRATSKEERKREEANMTKDRKKARVDVPSLILCDVVTRNETFQDGASQEDHAIFTMHR